VSQLVDYIENRRAELREQVHPDYIQILDSGFDLISFRMSETYADQFGPKFVRKVELLEVLLFSFINHCSNPETLDDMEKYLGEISAAKGDGGMVH